MNRTEFRQRAYGCYLSGFKRSTSTSTAGEDYQAKRYRGYLQRRLSRWLSSVSRDAEIADLGCGDGMLLRVFQEMGFTHLHGVEGSTEMWQLCRKNFPSVQEGDLREYLRRNAGNFSMVALFDVIEHFTREEAVEVLDEINAALKPGGLLLLQLPNGDSPFAHGVFAGDITHETLYTSGSLGHLLAISGFKLQDIDEHSPEPIDFRSSVRFLSWKVLRFLIGLCHRIETGGRSSGIYTRVMRVAARKVLAT